MWSPEPVWTMWLCCILYFSSASIMWHVFYCQLKCCVCWGVQKTAAKFANNTNESGWETLAQQLLIAQICTLFKAFTMRRAWKATGNRFLKPCYLSRDGHNHKIRTRRQRIDDGKYSFVNRTIKSWNQLPANLLAFFPCKRNMFRKRVKNAVTCKGIQVGTECK